MKLKQTENEHLSVADPTVSFDPKVAFLQIPTRYKERISEYINELAKDDEAFQKAIDHYNPSRESGCFFVISLEVIEEVLSLLKKSMNPELNQSTESRQYITEAISILNGR